MPDQDISDSLKTHPPDPEFVASTRTMLRAAWNEPLPRHTPPNNLRPGGSGVGHISRWMAGGAAAGLLVVAVGALLVLGRGGATPDGTAMPTVAPTLTTVRGGAATPATQPVPATPPPVAATPPPVAAASGAAETSTTVVVTFTNPEVTTTTDGTAAASGEPIDSKPAPTTSTTLPPTTTTAPVVTQPVPSPVYVRTEVPEWAYITKTDPLSEYPDHGVYGAFAPGSNQTVQLGRVFVGDDCVARFEKKQPGACADGYEFAVDPNPRTVKLFDGTPVVVPFTVPNEGIVWYEIPASEFANLLWTSTPDPSAPPGIELYVDWIGTYGVFQTLEGQVETLVFPGPQATAQQG